MRHIRLTLLTLLCVASVRLQAQVHIAPLFGEFSVLPNATEVRISGKKLKPYQLTNFHSIEVRQPQNEQMRHAESLVLSDARTAVAREEDRSNGRLHYGFYELPTDGRLHTYIFYRANAQKLTLIHIEGKASMEELKAYFKK
ncbi:MAG: hypothetical protein II645_04330 [Bacteroidaceae bacterium]|nr:hypothetical protein [Bacteroidaceae bacterium]MBQ3992364.1 hypothetical protein [Bacteroidaceae bacterium]MBQ4003152.1 hypothetical protein [Bacteroidaceae bacterium]